MIKSSKQITSAKSTKKPIQDWIESEMTDEIKDDVYNFFKASDKYYLGDVITLNQFENIMFKNGFDDQGYMWKWKEPIKSSRQIKSSTVPRTTKELADWMRTHTGWDVDYDEENDVFFSGPESEAHYIEKGQVVTDGDGWTEVFPIDEWISMFDEGDRWTSIKSALDTWVDPRSKVDGWKVKVLDVYPDDYAGSTTAKVELFDPEGNSQGEENIYIHRQDVKIGETYDARIGGIMAMPRIIGVPNISYDEVPNMKNVTRERYLKSALDTVKVTFDNGDTIVTDYNADVGREEIAKYYMHNYFNVGNEDEMHQVVKVEFPGNINSARVPEKADLDMAYQLEGYIESDHAMYDQFIVPVVKNLERKMKRGIFDYDKSLILWQHVADEGAKRYVKELGGPSYNVATRKEVAKNLAEYYKENYDVNGDIYNPIN